MNDPYAGLFEHADTILVKKCGVVARNTSENVLKRFKCVEYIFN